MCKAFIRALVAATFGLSLFISPAQAQILGAEPVTIGRYFINGDFGNGDVIFWYSPSNAIAGCQGGWISPSQPGAKNLIALLMLAKTTGAQLSVHLNTAVTWNGSGDKYCKVDIMGPT
ncbi:MAG: hypothetical protein A3I66_00025 [Burkholderiales bacterium RIFCSPLOWO2_02_FULL_57_36]|nr:MAG: hypothetical protein A3I66_00025 [Burkholderiales bacterium RIFCSPLOWO2_02_FULL_57_36]